MPRLTHPDAGAADFPEAVVPFWEANGWRREPGDKPPAARKLLVLARTKSDAADYAREADRADGEWVYPINGADVRGLSPESVDVAVVDGFTEHRYHAEISEELAAAGLSLS